MTINKELTTVASNPLEAVQIAIREWYSGRAVRMALETLKQVNEQKFTATWARTKTNEYYDWFCVTQNDNQYHVKRVKEDYKCLLKTSMS